MNLKVVLIIGGVMALIGIVANIAAIPIKAIMDEAKTLTKLLPNKIEAMLNS